MIAFFFAPGFLSPPSPADQAAVPGLEPAAGLDRCPGGLDQHRLDVGAGLPGPAGLALAGADVVPRAHGHPGGELVVAGEPPVRLGADLGQPGRGHHVPEPGDALEQGQLSRPPAGPVRDLPVQPGNRVIVQLDLIPVQAAQHGMVIGEPGGQRHRQVGLLARRPQRAPGQVRQHLGAGGRRR